MTSAPEDRGEGGAEPPGGDKVQRSRNRLIPIVIGSALFMDLMDSSALALALPSIAEHFNVSGTDLKLALTAYVVTVATLVPASAWAAGRFGARRVFLIAMVLFITGSVCCGLAGDVEQLIGARILQGVGGAMMTPVGRSIMVGSVDRATLVRAMAWYTMPAIVAPMIGPPLAGFLIEFADWRWIFFINVPVGLFGIVAVSRFVPIIEREPPRAFDFTGCFLYAVSILAIIALIETAFLSGFPWFVRIAAVLGAAGLACLYTWQALAARAPLVDLRVLRHATLRLSLAATWLQRVTLGALMLLLPLQLQVAIGLSPLVASQAPAFGALGSILSRIVCPQVLRRIGFRPMMASFAIGTALLTLVMPTFGLATPILAIGFFMMGFAIVRASFFMAGNSLAYADVPEGEIGHASVMFAIAQQLSLGFGFSLGGGLLAAAGGASDLDAYATAYPVIALLPLLAAFVVWQLPPRVGEHLRNPD